MADPMRETFLLFETAFGSNVRQWPIGAQDLKAAINIHLSKSLMDLTKIHQEKYKKVQASIIKFANELT